MVGNDFLPPTNHAIIQAMVHQGHEIANHTMTHAQGFRLLSRREKEAEVVGMEVLCERVTGQRPVGFRSPGWNIGDDALAILQGRGYLYDSSIHPTFLMPLLKFLHWHATSKCCSAERTTMGHMKYMFAPRVPYKTSKDSFSKKGENGIVEFPVTVTPIVRLPFFATFLMATRLGIFDVSFRSLKRLRCPIQFQFHLSDFVDYGHPALADQVPCGTGLYVPQSLRVPLTKKLAIFRRALDTIAADYSFNTLGQWATQLASL
jgi:hypothetical protein